MNVRFTAWMSESERDAIDAVAKENNTSVNYVVRIAIRRLLGLPSPLLHVTTETKDEQHA